MAKLGITEITNKLEVKTNKELLIKLENGKITAPEADITTLSVDNITINSTFSGNGLKSYLLNSLYPIGSIYTSISLGESNTCPIANTLGGTWERIEDYFLYAKKGNDTLTTGGSNKAYVVNHSHTINDSVSITGETNLAGEHGHTLRVDDRKWIKNEYDDENDEYRLDNSGNETGSNIPPSAGAERKEPNNPIQPSGIHSHTFTGNGWLNTTTTLQNVSSGLDVDNITDNSKAAVANMPKYQEVYVWKRIA